MTKSIRLISTQTGKRRLHKAEKYYMPRIILTPYEPAFAGVTANLGLKRSHLLIL